MSLELFHPTVRRWFAAEVGTPTRPQVEGWPAIHAGDHVLIAAPTGTGKTLAAFLSCDRRAAATGPELPRRDPGRLRLAAARPFQRHAEEPRGAAGARCASSIPSLPEVRVLVRTGDTPPASARRCKRRPPHMLVTTPESLYLLLTRQSGREMLRTARTVIVDEIHALARDKRGSHLALSLERLDGAVPRAAGRVAHRALGHAEADRRHGAPARPAPGGGACTIVDAGHLRDLDLGPSSAGHALTAVCTHEQWARDVRAAGGADPRAPQHADLRQHAQAGRAR